MNGVLVVYKEKGYTSRDVVNIVSKILGTKKIGHTGTLDPMAEGVLVLCVGKALKLVELLTNHDKEYVAKIRLGIETDTLDITGNVLKEEKVPDITVDEVREVLRSFVGKIDQEVPKYSAVKVNGKKLYEYARAGIEVERPVREVEIYDLSLISDIQNCEFVISCHVSKGTYIRSLVRDIGDRLGVVATMVELERTKLGNFERGKAYSLSDIRNGNYQLLDIRDVLNLPLVVVDDEFSFRIRNGQVLDEFFSDEMVLVLDEQNNLLAIYEKLGNGKVKPYRMFV